MRTGSIGLIRQTPLTTAFVYSFSADFPRGDCSLSPWPRFSASITRDVNVDKTAEEITAASFLRRVTAQYERACNGYSRGAPRVILARILVDCVRGHKGVRHRV